jgi:hypothetical protein
MDPVPDPLLLRKSGSTGNRSRDLWICRLTLKVLILRTGCWEHGRRPCKNPRRIPYFLELMMISYSKSGEVSGKEISRTLSTVLTTEASFWAWNGWTALRKVCLNVTLFIKNSESEPVLYSQKLVSKRLNSSKAVQYIICSESNGTRFWIKSRKTQSNREDIRGP